MNAVRFIRNNPGDKTTAFTNLAVTGSMIGGSLAWKAHPFWGGLLGLIAGIAATSFVEGSNANKLRSAL